MPLKRRQESRDLLQLSTATLGRLRDQTERCESAPTVPNGRAARAVAGQKGHGRPVLAAAVVEAAAEEGH